MSWRDFVTWAQSAPTLSPAVEKPEPPTEGRREPAAGACTCTDLYMAGSTIAPPGKYMGLWCRACDRLARWLTESEATAWAMRRKPEPAPEPWRPPSPVDLLRAGWTDDPAAELTAHRIWHALAAIKAGAIGDDRRQTLARDALEGPNGPRAMAGEVQAEVEAIERAGNVAWL